MGTDTDRSAIYDFLLTMTLSDLENHQLSRTVCEINDYLIRKSQNFLTSVHLAPPA